LTLGFTAAFVMVSDTIIAADSDLFRQSVLAQHWMFFCVCAVVGTLSILRLQQGLATLTGTVEEEEAKLGGPTIFRLKIYNYAARGLWLFCACFCFFCATGDQIIGSNMAEILSIWLNLHLAFIFAGGGSVASLLYMMVQSHDAPHVRTGAAIGVAPDEVEVAAAAAAERAARVNSVVAVETGAAMCV
jgi:hypothetical protein